MARLETMTNDASVLASRGGGARSASDPLAELRSIPLFRHCTKRVLRHIDGLCTRVDVREGRVLCSEGTIGRECFIVLAGRACVTIRRKPVKSLGFGDIIGEMALLTPLHRRTAKVTAVTPMSLLVFNPLEFDEVLRTDPRIRGTLLSEVTARLSENQVHAESCSTARVGVSPDGQSRWRIELDVPRRLPRLRDHKATTSPPYTMYREEMPVAR
jgi:hypothetical protein